MELVSLREYARRRGCSVEAVRKAIKTGRLARSVDYNGPNGWPRIDPEVANTEWALNTSESGAEMGRAGAEALAAKRELEGLPAKATKKKSEPVSDGEEKPEPPPPDPHAEERKIQSLHYQKARTAKEIFASKSQQLDYEERIGSLVRSDEVKKEAFKIGRTIRDQVLAIPDRISSELAGENNQFKIHKRLTEELRKALRILEPIDDREETSA